MLSPIALSFFLLACRAIAQPVIRDNAFPEPSEDDFYRAPTDLSSKPAGHVFRSRSFPSRYPGKFKENLQYYYRTNDHTDKESGTVGTVFVPNQPSYPPKILVYNIPEDAVNINCGPSYVWVNGTATRDTASNQLFMNWAVSKGFYLVNTDAEGPLGSWLVGGTEGRAVLDGVRAAINLLGLPKNSSVAFYGFSGGAFTSVWGSTLAQSYAPEINIVGAAHGGTVVDLEQTLYNVNGTSQSQLAVYGLLGLSKGYPDVRETLPQLLSPLGQNVTSQLLYLCPDHNNYTIITNGSIDPLFTSNPLEAPTIRSAVRQQSLLPNSTAGLMPPVPKFPRFIFQGKQDSVVPYKAAAAYVRDQCDRGADIRFDAFELLDHFPSQIAGQVAALQFLESALRGTVINQPCGTPIPAPIVGGPVADIYLGPELTPIALRTITTG